MTLYERDDGGSNLKWSMDNRETIHELIDEHMKNINLYRKNRDYSDWYDEINSLFDDVCAKITKKKKDYNSTEIVDKDQIGSSVNKKKTIKKKKPDVEKTFFEMCDKFEKLRNDKRFFATYHKRANHPRAHAILHGRLRTMTRWVFKRMEDVGLAGVSYQNEY